MDKNKDGEVSREDLLSLLSGLGTKVDKNVMNEMIAIVHDNSSNGKIKFKEFIAVHSFGIRTRYNPNKKN